MMRSLYSGVSGLAVHQSKMDVIGNNIANVNTLGFKASRVTFADVFSQTMQNASGPNEYRAGTNPMQIGLGTSLSSIDINMGEGSSQRTDNPLDLKIQGPGFFVVRTATGNKFTRAGAFKLDKAGNLANTSGMNVMGWPVSKDNPREIQKAKVVPMQIMSADNISAPPSTTKIVTVAGNINKNDPSLEGKGSPFTTQIYDSQGYRYTATFKLFKMIKTPATPTTPAVYEDPVKVEMKLVDIKDANGNPIEVNPAIDPDAVVQTLSFDDVGKVNKNGAGATSPSAISSQVENESAFDLQLILKSTPNGSEPATFGKEDTKTPANSGKIRFDFSNLTMYEGNTTVEAVAGDKDGLGSGAPAGTISGYEVSSDGKITAKYTNNATKLLGQIVIANFPNPEGLKKVGNNLFEATTNSGDFDGIGEDVSSVGASFTSGTLEMSNVDLSKEFTEMITTQRGFQANSRIITSSDEMLQELVNLKR